MELSVLKIDSEGKKEIKDIITDESFLTIYLNEKELLTLSCTFDKVKELSAGFLFSTGLIHSLDDIDTILINEKNMTSSIELNNRDIETDILFTRVYTSGCGKGVLFSNVLDLAHQKVVKSDFTIHSEEISSIIKAFERKSELFKKTGGVHSSALSNSSSILVFCEDIGRHNSIDKVIGEALYGNLNMAELVILTTGRISSEILYKIQKTGSPVIVSRSAPTSLAVKLAKKWNITLIGFARGKKMNVYTAKDRIV